MKKLLLLIVTFALVALAAYVLDYYEGAGPLAAEKTVVFKRGAGFRSMVDTLEREGVITDAKLFAGLAVALGKARTLKAGEYLLPAGISPHQLMDLLASGKVVVHKVTIPEGYMVSEVLATLVEEPLLEGDINVPVEGSLLPDTYHFTYGDTRQEVLDRMSLAMTKLLNELWAKRKEGLPFKTPQEALILASIVEKETGVHSERARVAAVFINRLRLGMRLQTDPTVAYGIEQQLGRDLGRALTLNDLQKPTPYNTYVIDGLPPTPIANPGRAALEATLNPADTDELYFVASGSGGHRFAKTLKEHNANVQSYRQIKRAKN